MNPEQKEFFDQDGNYMAREMYYREVLRQIEALRTWTAFILEGYQRGVNMKLTVEVDGVGCDTGPISLGRTSGMAMAEWLYNWGCSRLLLLFEERDEIHRLWPRVGANLPDRAGDGE